MFTFLWMETNSKEYSMPDGSRFFKEKQLGKG